MDMDALPPWPCLRCAALRVVMRAFGWLFPEPNCICI
jgi:hypothetical protein